MTDEREQLPRWLARMWPVSWWLRRQELRAMRERARAMVNDPAIESRGYPNFSPNVSIRHRSTSHAAGLWPQAAIWGLKVATSASAAIPMVAGLGLNRP